MKTLNQTLIVLSPFTLLLIDSCRCQKEPGPDPDCPYVGQVYRDGVCQCTSSDKYFYGGRCIRLQSDHPNFMSWTPLNQNGNCLDSSICYWLLDTALIGVDTPRMFGGKLQIFFQYYGRGQEGAPEFYEWQDFQGVIKEEGDGYKLSGIMNNHLDRGQWIYCIPSEVDAMWYKGQLSADMDTMQLHFSMTSWASGFHAEYGEFDQIFVR